MVTRKNSRQLLRVLGKSRVVQTQFSKYCKILSHLSIGKLLYGQLPFNNYGCV